MRDFLGMGFSREATETDKKEWICNEERNRIEKWKSEEEDEGGGNVKLDFAGLV